MLQIDIQNTKNICLKLTLSTYNIIVKATCLDKKVTVPLRILFRYAYGVRIRSQNLSHKYCNGKVYFSISLSVIRGCVDVVEDLIIE